MSPEERRAHLTRARDLFNGGEFWLAHEALETVWRSIIREDEARAWQGLIQAAAALLHRARGNRHGTVVVGAAALEKLAGPQRPEIEFETVHFRAYLARALAEDHPPPRGHAPGARESVRVRTRSRVAAGRPASRGPPLQRRPCRGGSLGAESATP